MTKGEFTGLIGDAIDVMCGEDGPIDGTFIDRAAEAAVRELFKDIRFRNKFKEEPSP